MPPIPIFTQSPVNAAKADGATPKTTESPDARSQAKGPEATTTAPPPPTGTSPYPAPQPGARPPGPTEAPAPTTTATHTTTVHPRYAPAAVTTSAAPGGGMSPPPPQPGAVPTPPGRTMLPPPPKAGESKVSNPDRGTGPTTGEPRPTGMPPQMEIPPPMTPQSRGGTSIAPVPTGPRPTTLFEGGAGSSPGNNPLGYQQGAHQHQGFITAGSTGYQPPSRTGQAPGGLSGAEEEDDGVWGAAKKWAQAAGGSIAAAEDEVWRRINKG